LRMSNPERFSWERRPNPDLTIEELDRDLILMTLHDGVNNHRIHASALAHTDTKDVLSGLGLINREGVLLNAANVLFGKEPTRSHIHCSIRLARFEGTDKMVFRDQTVCDGNLFEQYDETIDFCRKHLFMSGRMDGKVRVDTLTVPFEVIKEATMNMLCHRSWDAENLTPSLAIYDDRMEFQNPGMFPVGYTWQDFVKFFNSMPCNPLIASVFYRRGLMERWGRGIGLIMNKCAAAGMPDPVFEVSHSFVTLTIRFRQPITASGGLNGRLNGGLNMSEREQQVLKVLQSHQRFTIDEVATEMKLSKRTMERIFASLKRKGMIEKDGSKKTGVWVIMNGTAH